jgi:large subunit ribosomal protein L3
MAIGLVGRKCGMTRVFTDAGVSVPVTVIEVDPNRITQIKTLETDGYQAIQITTGERRESRVTAAQKGHFAKAGVAAGRGLVQEFRVKKLILKVVKLVATSA